MIAARLCRIPGMAAGRDVAAKRIRLAFKFAFSGVFLRKLRLNAHEKRVFIEDKTAVSALSHRWGVIRDPLVGLAVADGHFLQ